MSNSINWQSITTSISQVIDAPVSLSSIAPVSGGDIHAAWHAKNAAAGTAFFIKTNGIDAYPVLHCEAQSLEAIAAVNQIKTPKPVVHGVAHGKTQDHAFLVLEYLPLAHSGDEALLGQQLANMHWASSQKKMAYGFSHDNFIGLTPQKNTEETSWSNFWVNQRIRPQCELAFNNGFANELQPLFNDLLLAVAGLLTGYQPPSVLLHGDLWSGNKAFVNEQPVIFDPACYYGDRETDIAMTELFAGFSPAFYHAYESVWPLDKGYSDRKALYKLYHLLNHLNIFGQGYLPQVKNSILQLIHR